MQFTTDIIDSMSLKPGLYIVSTPIGNLTDITIRAIDTLQKSDYIACEDTRIAQKLCLKYNIHKPKLLTYNDHSKKEERSIIKNFILQNKAVSLISDAGTPLISDPGFKLIQFLRQDNLNVDVIPGVSSPITALTISGLPTNQFFFAGFLPKTINAKEHLFIELKNLPATLIFFERSERLKDSLTIANKVFGNRLSCIARELTKIHQTIILEPIQHLIGKLESQQLRGEIILLIEGFVESTDNLSSQLSNTAQILCSNLDKSIVSFKTMLNVIQQIYPKVSRNKIYEILSSVYR